MGALTTASIRYVSVLTDSYLILVRSLVVFYCCLLITTLWRCAEYGAKILHPLPLLIIVCDINNVTVFPQFSETPTLHRHLSRTSPNMATTVLPSAPQSPTTCTWTPWDLAWVVVVYKWHFKLVISTRRDTCTTNSLRLLLSSWVTLFLLCLLIHTCKSRRICSTLLRAHGE